MSVRAIVNGYVVFMSTDTLPGKDIVFSVSKPAEAVIGIHGISTLTSAWVLPITLRRMTHKIDHFIKAWINELD